jgi:SM-20-related protein
MTPFTDADVAQLGSGNAVVRDGVLSTAEIEAMRDAIETLPLRPAGVGKAAQVEDRVRGDHIAWLEPDTHPAFAPAFALFDALLRAAREELWLGVVDYELHAARYEAGAGYQAHHDTLRGDARRRFSVVLYLNPSWRPADGGELLTWPEGMAARRIAPIAGRLVTFLPHRLLHAVAPSHAPRFSVTGWLRGPG